MKLYAGLPGRAARQLLADLLVGRSAAGRPHQHAGHRHTRRRPADTEVVRQLAALELHRLGLRAR